MRYTEAQILSDEEDELIEQVVTSDGTIHPAALRFHGLMPKKA